MELKVVTKLADPVTQSKPLLFVHGAWHGSWCWEEYFIPYFVKLGYNCYALNLRGHGGSPIQKKLRFTTIGDYVKDLISVIDSLDTEPIVVAHSMGGLLAQHYLTQYPLEHTILLAPVPPWGVWRTTFKVAFTMPLAFLKANLVLSLGPIADSPKKAKKICFSSTIEEEKLHKFANLMQSESYFAYLGMLGLSLPKVKEVNTNMLVLGGNDDFLFNPKQMEGVAKRYNAELVMFEDMAHDLMLDNGWEKVAETIHQWIQKQS